MALRIVSIQRIFTRLGSRLPIPLEVLPLSLGTLDLTRGPRIRMCCPTSGHGFEAVPALTAIVRIDLGAAGLDPAGLPGPGTMMKFNRS